MKEEPRFCSPYCRYISVEMDLIHKPFMWKCTRYPGYDGMGDGSYPPFAPKYCNYVDLFTCGLAHFIGANVLQGNTLIMGDWI
jgi:hypothetical protein